MKTPKSRKKSFRVDCASCHATQDSLRYACAQCKQRLYTNVEQDELEGVVANVAEMEAILSELEKPSPQKGNPYDPVDKAWTVYRGLRRFQFLPGMPAYLDGVLEALLPFQGEVAAAYRQGQLDVFGRFGDFSYRGRPFWAPHDDRWIAGLAAIWLALGRAQSWE
jgi:hypothetical protein